MTARVLVVDDIIANVKLLEARLTAEYFEVLTAYNGREALDILARERVDVVLLDVMMPGMDGFEVCRTIKKNVKLQHVPVIMVTALDQTSDRIQGLEAGADDFLTKPVDDVALVTRVKNVARLKTLNDEMLMRAATTQQMGMSAAGIANWSEAGNNGRILLVEDHARSAARMVETLGKHHRIDIETDPAAALLRTGDHHYDLVIVSLGLSGTDGLRLCSQLRSLDRTRSLPLIILVDIGDEARLLRGLDMGVNDYLTRPIDNMELLARVRTQITRKRYTDVLRDRIDQSVGMAITDGLTGLHNRRYLETHLKTLLDRSRENGRPLAVLIADIDHFKKVNDTHGHDGGDAVLREFANRLRRNTRGIDLACRLGGEEFVIVMPDTDLMRAWAVGERLRACIAAEPFQINSETELRVTASVGVAATISPEDTPDTLYKRADTALYSAKRDGRNRVIADAA
ncbi:MAG TPA: PleD family two-component system response regulator [Hyphomicrobiaceae bacterium]|nr:PleD family two-component system response regulator [Hyphomicrobiaceae bacterium]